LSYIVAKSPKDLYDKHLENINFVHNNLGQNEYLMVLGDYNLRNTSWFWSDAEKRLLPSSGNNDYFLVDSLFSMDLMQINDINNSLGRILDLIFVNTNLEACLTVAENPLVSNSIHHKALEVSIKMNEFASYSKPIKKRNFKKANFTNINSYLSNLIGIIF